MRILVIAHYQNCSSIIAPYIRDQLRAYAELGNQVLVISPIAWGKKDHLGFRFGPAYRLEEIDGVQYAFLRYLSFSRFGSFGLNTCNAISAAAVFLLKTIKDFSPEIIHANTLGFDSEIGAWMKKRLACPLVVTTHGSDSRIPLEKGKGKQLHRWMKHADTVVCVSRILQKKLLDIDPEADIRVIHNGFNVKSLKSDSISPKKYSVIQVGNLIPSKRVDDTIRAVALVKKHFPEITLTIVGQGTEKTKLLKLCEALEMADSVTFTGQIDNDKVLEMLAESEYYVMVSSPEGFGIVYLEAMASKCLTIGAKNEGIEDLIRSGENGFLLPVGRPEIIAETLLWAIRHPKESKKIAENGYSCAIEHTWEYNAREYLMLFCTLTEKK